MKIPIKNYDNFAKIEPINKGWSSDIKYYIETVDGRRHMENVLCWFENMQSTVPTWYLKNINTKMFNFPYSYNA